jgi:hypothetical protein
LARLGPAINCGENSPLFACNVNNEEQPKEEKNKKEEEERGH